MRARILGTITGRVQGVGFRAAAGRKAREMGLVGYIQNLKDGRVELSLEGQKEHLNSFLKWCYNGIKGASVD